MVSACGESKTPHSSRSNALNAIRPIRLDSHQDTHKALNSNAPSCAVHNIRLFYKHIGQVEFQAMGICGESESEIFKHSNRKIVKHQLGFL